MQHRDFAGHEIRSAARPDIDELLGAALRKREPCALHLNHHPVSGAERMRDVGHAERHAGRNARLTTTEYAATLNKMLGLIRSIDEVNES